MDFSDIILTAVRFALGPQIAVYVLAAVGLNLHLGYTGLTNFGVAGYLLVGAYGTAIGVLHLHLPLGLAVLLGLAASATLSLLLGLPTLRLNTIYLGIATLAVAEVLRLLVRSDQLAPVSGGVYGLNSFAAGFHEMNPLPERRFGVGAVSWLRDDFWFMIVAWVCIAVVTLLVWLLMRSPWGRVIVAIREDEQVPRSLGKRVYLRKVQSLMLGGLIISLAGVLMSIGQQSTTPDVFLPDVTFYIYTGLILGGVGCTFGPIVGTVLFWFILTFFDNLLRSGYLGDVMDTTQIGAFRFILSGLGLMILIVFRPGGLLGRRNRTGARPRWARWRPTRGGKAVA